MNPYIYKHAYVYVHAHGEVSLNVIFMLTTKELEFDCYMFIQRP